MLVLTRKADQIINIGDDIRIKILEIGNGYVKLGIDAPKEMPIYREELYEKLKQLNRESARVDIERLKDFLGIEKNK
ncbi:MAG TPA: carbon storage regulator CsrA [Dissulfurispiraceae bacterium]